MRRDFPRRRPASGRFRPTPRPSLTTNLAFSHWPGIFPHATSATALIDRVIHHAEISAIEGDRFRRREGKEARKRRRKRPAA